MDRELFSAEEDKRRVQAHIYQRKLERKNRAIRRLQAQKGQSTEPPPPVDKRSYLRKFIEGDSPPAPKVRKHKGGWLGFLERLQ